MNYKITIIRSENNPAYLEYEKQFSSLTMPYDDRNRPPEFLEYKVLEIDLTEEEFKAIKKATLEVM